MTPDQFVFLSDQIVTLQKSVDRIYQDLDGDRQDLSEFRLRISALEAQVDEMRKAISTLPQKTKDKMDDAVEEVVTATQNLQDSIQDKKFISIKPKKKSWWIF